MSCAGSASCDDGHQGDPLLGLAWAVLIDGLVLIVVLLIFGLVTCVADAQDVPTLPTADELQARCAPEVPDALRGGRVAVQVGADTVPSAAWFHPEVVRCMTTRLRLLPEYAELVAAHEARSLAQERVDALRGRQVELAEEAERRATDALGAAVRGRREAEEDRDAWHRSPLLWAGIGVVLAVVVEVTAVWLLDEVSE
jgi:hypothetical protein